MVVAIVVTYFPDHATLYLLLGRLRMQAQHVVVVDNGSGSEFKKYIESIENADALGNVTFIFLNENIGIAAAQNQGIEWAKEHRASDVVLFDQDSIPSIDLVRNLVDAKQILIAQGLKVAAVGSRYIDIRRDNPPPFIRIEGLRLVRCKCDESNGIVPVEYLISSGCLIPMNVINDVGGMENRLFIDYVDIEWGLRAKVKGYQSYGSCLAQMNHSLGDEPINFIGMKIPLHSPLRHFYHFRNAVWLYRQPWVKVNWKIVDGYKLFLKYIFYTIFAKPRLLHLKMMSLGIWHGLTNKLGKYDGKTTA